MAIIVPAILEKTKEDFEVRAESFERIPDVQRVQVDFADGKFVENKTISIEDIDALNPAITWEAHLMVEEPVDFFDYQMVGFNVVVVHFEAFADSSLIVEALAHIRAQGLKAGLAVNPETPVSLMVPYASSVDQFTFLSVHPGKQGQPFLEATYERVRDLRRMVPNAVIEVDGGISVTNAKQLIQAGADLLVVGSAMRESPSRAFVDLQSSLT